MSITHYRQLQVWSKAMDLAEAVYAAAKHMPRQEEYRLTAQLLRAAVSVPANIAEGNARATRKEYARFISIAKGSVAELETLLLLAERTRLIPVETVRSLHESVEEVGRMLNKLHTRLTSPQSPVPSPQSPVPSCRF